MTCWGLMCCKTKQTLPGCQRGNSLPVRDSAAHFNNLDEMSIHPYAHFPVIGITVLLHTHPFSEIQAVHISTLSFKEQFIQDALLPQPSSDLLTSSSPAEGWDQTRYRISWPVLLFNWRTQEDKLLPTTNYKPTILATMSLIPSNFAYFIYFGA